MIKLTFDPSTLHPLLDAARACPAEGSDSLDLEICLALGILTARRTETHAWYSFAGEKAAVGVPIGEPMPPNMGLAARAWRVTTSLDAAKALVERILPGWWWRIGTCSVSDDATIGPDRNGPDAHLLAHRQFDEGFDVDRRPPGSVPLALVEAAVLALIARAEHAAAAETGDA